MAYSSTFLNNVTVPGNEQIVEINAETRTINIPKKMKNLAVNGDHLSETIYFKIPRFFDNKDFTEHKCMIRWLNANNEYGETEVINTEYDNDFIKFGWLIDNLVTAYSGDIHFTVQFDTVVAGVEYQWQTTPAVFTILNGIEDSHIDPTGGDESKYREIMNAINKLSAEVQSMSNVKAAVDNIVPEIAALETRVKFLEDNSVMIPNSI